MSLKALAETVRAHGRGDDTVLIHMTPREVAGLQKLAVSHGGSLTINPKTGLPEAGFLKSILPTLLGVGGMFMGIPTPLLMGLGAVGAKATGQNPLVGALGAFGGAGLAGGLAGLGGAAAAGAAPGAIGAAGAATPTAGLVSAASQGMSAAPGIGASTLTPGIAGVSGATTAPIEVLAQGAGDLSGAAPSLGQSAGGWGQLQAIPAQPGIMDRVASAGTGIEQLMTPGSGIGMDTLAKQMPMGLSPTTMGMMAASPALLATPDRGGPNIDKGMIRPYRYDSGYQDQSGHEGSSEAKWYDSKYTPEEPYKAAGGGEVPAPRGMSGASKNAFEYLMGAAPTSRVAPPAASAQTSTQTGAVTGGMPKYSFDPKTQQFSRVAPAAEDYDAGFNKANATPEQRAKLKEAALPQRRAAGGGLQNDGFVIPADVVSMIGNGSSSAGLEALASRYGARPIKGPGDGMSDSIETHIDGVRRARVAREEAYIPPGQVKSAGGAKKLYSMMAKVRKQAHGKDSQQRKVNPSKVLA